MTDQRKDNELIIMENLIRLEMLKLNMTPLVDWCERLTPVENSLQLNKLKLQIIHL